MERAGAAGAGHRVAINSVVPMKTAQALLTMISSRIMAAVHTYARAIHTLIRVTVTVTGDTLPEKQPFSVSVVAWSTFLTGVS